MDDATPVRKTVLLRADEISYLDSGRGRPLLLLHGVGHSSTAWLRSIPALAKRYRVIAPDMPGHGHSAVPDAAYDPASFGRFALAFIDALGLGTVDAGGNSLGALTTMLAALDRPAAFRKIVLVDPLGFTTPPVPPLGDVMLHIIGLWLSFPRTRALVRSAYASGFYDAAKIDEASVDEIAARATSAPRMDAARRTMREIFHFSKHLEQLHARLVRLAPSALVIWGKNDPVLPVKDVEMARRVLPAPRIEVLERCGHCPHIEQPEAFCALVLDFLDAA